MEDLDAVRSHVVTLMQGGLAFESFDVIASSFEPNQRGVIPNGMERSAWQILAHIVFAQRDILDFSRNSNGDYVEKEWPDDYWPKSPEPPTETAWTAAIAAYHADREALESMVADDANDLFTAFPWGDGQTLLREALMSAEHTAYHLGQLIVLSEVL